MFPPFVLSGLLNCTFVAGFFVVLMRYQWHSTLFFLTVILLVHFAASMESSSWDDMQIKHTWNSVPVNWESLGHPPAGSTIRLYIALKSERESALIDALSEVSNPRHPRHVLLTTPPLVTLFTCVAGPFQIWRTPFSGTGCRACRAPPGDTRAH